ncbi:putative dna excision repair protein [Phaeomoniella chlamydospora]|uniref:Putative dna excision repair protein n=1 Tax=Phaeomoniella chlamydospora TaxID=158046 RepID=A0A0G2EE28_PHACM|nr:putative dna excision repair protein [Phaeomoniella chlamydospora]
MSTPEIDQRPAKKRRFFVDEPVSTAEINAETSSSPSPLIPSTSSRTGTDQQTQHDSHKDGNDAGASFDTSTFLAFIGQPLSPDVAQQIEDAAGGDMERAVNMFFDGSWKTAKKPPQSSTPPAMSLFTRKRSETQRLRDGLPAMSEVTPAKSRSPTPQHTLTQMPAKRYIGAFGVAAWATKSGLNLLRHGEKVLIQRTKLTPKTKLGRGGKATPVIARSQKADVITRFTNECGEEIGRLPKENAEWVSTLVDQKVCHFEGSCVYAPDRIRVNDTVYLQIRCYMLKSAFEAGGFVLKEENRATGIFEEKESSEEKDLRLRQVALVKLFDEINLRPTAINEMTAKHKKEGILKAAEIAEQYDKNKAQQNGQPPPGDDEDEEGELEEDQLDTLYKKAQSFDFDTPEAEPASTFSLSLRKYQKQALHWMLAKERQEKPNHEVFMHPLWEEYTWPGKDIDDVTLPEVAGGTNFYVNPYSGELSLEFPIQEQNCLGGILADEMGLGKTIEMMSLIHTHKSNIAESATEKGLATVNNLPRLPQNSSSIEPAPCTTLVVAPMSLLAQWESEAAKASKTGSMKTLLYYGNDKSANLQNLCSAANAASAPTMIITSYGVVLSEFNQVVDMSGNRGSHGGLFSVEYFRVILDEAHHIKNRQSKTAKACYEIAAKHRWVLTGTPIVNRLEDLFSLVRFLKVEPWSNFSFWKTFITVPFESKEIVRALNVVQTVLEPLVLRRTKDMKTPEGEALVPLPPRQIVIEEVELSKAEREVYDFIFTRAKRTFNASMQAGTVLKSFTTIFAQLLRLRQSCCHPVLTRNKEIVAEEEETAASEVNGLADDVDLQDLINRFTAQTKSAEACDGDTGNAQDTSAVFSATALRQIQTESTEECPICSEEPMIDPAVTTCWHTACKKCLEDYIEHQIDKGDLPRCFNCRKPVTKRDIFEVVKYNDTLRSSSSSSSNPNFDPSTPSTSSADLYASTPPTNGTSNPRISLRRLHPYSPSSATSAKIAKLLRHLASLPSPNTKSVIFSQFTSFLDLISAQLTRQSLPHLRFDGTLTQQRRSEVLRTFSSESTSSSSPKILLLSLRAGGVGLNLTSASHVFMMDPWWSFAVEAQAIDRVHRMGQINEVKVTRFVVKDSIEERMLRVQERKMAVAGTLGVGAGDNGSANGKGGSEEERRRRRIEELEILFS